jgi:hypothetical protein
MTMTTATTFAPGDVVAYTSSRDNNWCREGLALVSPDGKFRDTYWGSNFGDNHVLTAEEIASARLEFNVNDFREMERYETPAWDEYHPNDRQLITSQHRLQRRYFVRVGSTSDFDTRVEKARAAVLEAEEKVQSAESSLRWAKRELAALEVAA